MSGNIRLNPRRIGVLIWKDIRQGSGNFLAVFAVIMPVVITLLVNLFFGNLFSQMPRLGLVDPGGSQVTLRLQETPHIRTTLYPDEASLREAVSRGVEELALVLQPDLDGTLTDGGTVSITILRWGEAPAQSLLTLSAVINRAFATAADIPQQISIEPILLGATQDMSWSQRLLPLILIMAVTLGGLLIAATTLIEERQMHTLSAVTTTSASLFEVYVAKLALGVVVAILVGVVTLTINRAFGDQPLLLVGILALGGLAASVLGILLGSVAKDMDTFMAIVKGLGIVLYAPGLVKMFPDIPAWIGKLFPTYYVMNPLIEVTQNGAGWPAVSGEVAILAAIAGAMLLFLALRVEHQQQQIAIAG